MTILTFLALIGRNKWYVAPTGLKTIYSFNLGRCPRSIGRCPRSIGRCPRLFIYRPVGAQFVKKYIRFLGKNYKRFTPKGYNTNNHERNSWQWIQTNHSTPKGYNTNSHECNSWEWIRTNHTTPKGLNPL